MRAGGGGRERLRAEVGVKQGIALLALGLAALAGCAREVEAPSVAEYEEARAELAQRAKSGPDRAASAAPRDEQGSDAGYGTPTYSYDPTGKRDPFRSYVLEQKEQQQAKRGPLEQFELGQLKLTAVIWKAEKPRALVLDPSGRGYIIGAGTRIGKNSGEVLSIGESVVVVKETYVDHRGKSTVKNVEMRIQHSQGG